MKRNIIIMAASLLVVFLVYSALQLVMPLPFGNQSMEFEIKRGSSFKEIVEGLSEKGILRDKWVFLLLGRVTGADRKIKAGFYPLWGSMSPLQIFNAIRKGKIIEYEITVIPGDSLWEIGEKFSSVIGTEPAEFQKLCTDREFLEAFDVDAPSLEGYLFPDTYRFPKGLDAKDVLILMLNRMRDQFDEEMMMRQMELNVSEKEVLTMASIVEKEAISEGERTVIAGVYYNRLKKHMLLQADPTAIYGVKSSKERITKADLLKKTAYNTYFIKGLPPGPIASPGLKSIRAALNPSDVPYLYFVSNQDGTHTFSVTLGEHAEAVKAYREKRGTRG
ncbi:MAG TPA: endolytic transglycosylase MltG [Thermodesulfovibrionales bacterium]|nr:endolytic transglycosylase MltG [Thermodesulfovibrionales bacterium]